MIAGCDMTERRRTHGEGAIYATSDGRLRGAIRLIDPRTGKPVRRYVSGRSRAEVARKLAALRAGVASGVLPGRLTLEAYLVAWLERQRVRWRPSTWRAAERLARTHVIPRLGRIEVARLRPADVEALTAAIVESGRSPTTAAAARQLLRRALGDAVRDGLASRNVAALARPPRRAARELLAGRDFYAPDDLRRLLTVCETDDDVGPLVALAALTGARLGELLGLRWEAVDLARATMTIRTALVRDYDGKLALAEPKTPRGRRTVPLAPLAVAALERRRTIQERERAAAGDAWQDRWGLVFTDPAGRPLADWTVNKAYHRLAARAGLPSIPFHGLRHSWASAALVAGVPMRVVAEVLGHASPAFTASVYAGVAPELARDAVGALEATLRQ